MRLLPAPSPLRRAAPPRAFLVVLALVLAACGGTTPSASPAGSSDGAIETPAGSLGPEPTASQVAYPLTITDDEGTAVTIQEPPTRIVSLTPATTEILFAIGAGPKVVGRTASDDYPPQAASVATVASYTGVDVEKIVGLGADLVIAGGNGFNPPEAIARLRALHVPVLVVYAATVDAVVADIRLVGQAAGEAPAASDLADTMAAQLDAIAAATDGIERPSVFYETGDQPAIYGIADSSLYADMIERAGGAPVTTGSTTNWQMSVEALISANPDVILLGDAAYDVTADQVRSRPGWGTIQAVKVNAIFAVDDVVITRPGPRLVQGLVDLVRVIHPELLMSPLDSGAP